MAKHTRRQFLANKNTCHTANGGGIPANFIAGLLCVMQIKRNKTSVNIIVI